MCVLGWCSFCVSWAGVVCVCVGLVCVLGSHTHRCTFCTCVYMSSHTYTHMYTHTYTHIYMSSWALVLVLSPYMICSLCLGRRWDRWCDWLPQCVQLHSRWLGVHYWAESLQWITWSPQRNTFQGGVDMRVCVSMRCDEGWGYGVMKGVGMVWWRVWVWGAMKGVGCGRMKGGAIRVSDNVRTPDIIRSIKPHDRTLIIVFGQNVWTKVSIRL